MDFFKSHSIFYYLCQSPCVVLGMSQKLTGMSLHCFFKLTEKILRERNQLIYNTYYKQDREPLKT